MRFSSLSALFASCALTVTASAEVVNVPLGASLAAAVQAAQPGDTLLLQAGEYTDSTTLVIDKRLTVLGAGSGHTTYKVLASGPPSMPMPLLVRDIGPQDRVRVMGIRFDSVGPYKLKTVGVVEQCEGPVLLADLSFTWLSAPVWSGSVPGAFVLRDAAQVAIVNCEIFCVPEGLGGPGGLVATTGLYVDRSTVSIANSEIRGETGQSYVLHDLGGHGGPALHAVDSTVSIARSVVLGGEGTAGWQGYFVWGTPGDGGPGIVAESSTVRIGGGPSNVLRGGAGSMGANDLGAGAPAAQLDANSQLESAIDARLVAGSDAGLVQVAPLVGGAGSWDPLTERLATVRGVQVMAHPGGAATWELAGEAFGVGLIGFSIGQSQPLELPGIFGSSVLHLNAVVTLPLVALGPEGLVLQTTPLPAIQALAGLTSVVQGLVMSPSGRFSLSPPIALALVP